MSSSNRILQISDCPLPLETFYPIALTVTEHLGWPFTINVQLISERTDITAQQMLHQPFGIQLNYQDQPRYFHGRVETFMAREIREGIRFYQAILKPEFHFLSYKSTCQIHQNCRVPDLIEQLVRLEAGGHIQQHLTNTYPKREYLVQYNESTFNFLQRLIEETGLYYSFNHQAQAHSLQLHDHSRTAEKCPKQAFYQTTHSGEIQLSQFQRQYEFYPGKWQERSHNYETPHFILEGKSQVPPDLESAKQFQHYYYHLHSFTNFNDAHQQSQVFFESLEARHSICVAQSQFSGFNIGHIFTLKDAPQKQDCGDYLLIHQVHHAFDTTYLHGQQGGQHYHNQLQAIPSHLNFRLPKVTPKPMIAGPQTAIVAGDSEIDLDELGRVTVQFHWDRQQQTAQKTSCRVRVAQAWASQGFGCQFFPRVGDEVIVHFIDGNPDLPLVIGSVYHPAHALPFQLSENPYQSGLMSRSAPEGLANTANIICFNDKNGNENLLIQAQKDLSVLVKNNESKIIKQNFTTQVQQGHYLLQILSGNCTIESETEIIFKVASNEIRINPAGIYLNGNDVKIKGL